MKLKELRAGTRLSQSEFAKKFNLTQGTYSNYENETTQPDIRVLIEIADYYNVTLDYLVGRPFANDAGYLTSDEKEMLAMFRKLDNLRKAKAIAYTAGMLTME